MSIHTSTLRFYVLCLAFFLSTFELVTPSLFISNAATYGYFSRRSFSFSFFSILGSRFWRRCTSTIYLYMFPCSFLTNDECCMSLSSPDFNLVWSGLVWFGLVKRQCNAMHMLTYTYIWSTYGVHTLAYLYDIVSLIGWL